MNVQYRGDDRFFSNVNSHINNGQFINACVRRRVVSRWTHNKGRVLTQRQTSNIFPDVSNAVGLGRVGFKLFSYPRSQVENVNKNISIEKKRRYLCSVLVETFNNETIPVGSAGSTVKRYRYRVIAYLCIRRTCCCTVRANVAATSCTRAWKTSCWSGPTAVAAGFAVARTASSPEPVPCRNHRNPASNFPRC